MKIKQTLFFKYCKQKTVLNFDNPSMKICHAFSDTYHKAL